MFSKSIVSAVEMRRLDQWTIDEFGLSVDVLMETAGRRVAQVIADFIGTVSSVVVVFGCGHNGADGLVAARSLYAKGMSVRVVTPFGRLDLTPSCLRQLERCERLGIRSELDCAARQRIEEDDVTDYVYVDALFGTGLGRNVSGSAAEWVDRMNQAASSVVSVDIPSGVCADTGQIMGVAVTADVTVAFQHSKLGHWMFPGADARGVLYVEDIGIPSIAMKKLGVPSRYVLSREDVFLSMPQRPDNGHKGTFGHVGVLGGHAGMTGATKLAGMGALRSGAGKCTILCEPRIAGQLACELDVLMCSPDESLSSEQGNGDAPLVACDAYAIGVGVDPSRVSPSFSLWITGAAPRVIDAGALTWLADQAAVHLGDSCILTPHPAEAARLLGTTAEVIQADRFQAIGEIVQKFGCFVVLKGAYTLISGPNCEVVLCPYGNSGLASAGTGDVLAGLIAGLLAQGFSPWSAARIGVVWHALAGDLAREVKGEHVMIATDVIDSLAGVQRC